MSRKQLESLHASARIKPTFVQNRCYARTGWDRDVRDFCRSQQIRYQGFSLLTANRTELADPRIEVIAQRLQATVAQVAFRFAQAVGVLPLTGTSDPAHMAEDLRCASLALRADELRSIEDIGARV